uniref:Ovule protein n=1 Tax=Panagrellus redivivus TaxID=6233 RepID=A0A7E4WBR0_PANRE
MVAMILCILAEKEGRVEEANDKQLIGSRVSRCGNEADVIPQTNRTIAHENEGIEFTEPPQRCTWIGDACDVDVIKC